MNIIHIQSGDPTIRELLYTRLYHTLVNFRMVRSQITIYQHYIPKQSIRRRDSYNNNNVFLKHYEI